jgi:hypothetical protein
MINYKKQRTDYGTLLRLQTNEVLKTGKPLNISLFFMILFEFWFEKQIFAKC